MEPFEFPDANDVLRKPESMTDEQCADLPILRMGPAGVVSAWKMTDAERELFAETGTIYLWALAETHPPVALCVEKPYEIIEQATKEGILEACDHIAADKREEDPRV